MWALDIETDTTVPAHSDGMAPAGLDPRVSPILCLAVAADTEPTFVTEGEEPALLEAFVDWWQQLDPDDTVVTWNGSRFDFPFIGYRLVEHDLPVPFDYWAYRADPGERQPIVTSGGVWHVSGHIDLHNVLHDYRTRHRISGLKATLASAGIPHRQPTVSGAQSGRIPAALLADYCAADAEATLSLAKTVHPYFLDLWKVQ